MQNVVSKRCTIDGCDKIPNFGLEWKKPTHCGDHIIGDMKDVKSKRCSTCDTTTMNSKYKPNCSRCHFYLNPNDPRIRNYKTKEHAFMLPLKEKYGDMILDKTVSGGCSKRRPDGLLECFTHSIIIEIDEDQHIGYESICDNKRTMELFQDLGSRPIMFIRLNPDSYKINNKRIKGCFSISKSGEMKVLQKELAHRLDTLMDAIDISVKTKPKREISSVKLFYSDD